MEIFRFMTIPQPSQRTPNSNSQTSSSVWSWHRRVTPSVWLRLNRGAVHLRKKWESEMVWKNEDILWAPPLHNAWQKSLFGVVGNIWAEVINDSPIVTIRASCDFWHSHARLKRVQNRCEWGVQKLSTKFSIWYIVFILFFRWYKLELVCHITSMEEPNLLFGIARKPKRTTPFLCAHRALLWIFPMER